jgi:hypothetical protein
MLASNEELARKLATLEKKYDSQFRVVFEAIRELMAPTTPKRGKIGFLVSEAAAKIRCKVSIEHRHGSRIGEYRAETQRNGEENSTAESAESAEDPSFP